jgi:hypothetical protein
MTVNPLLSLRQWLTINEAAQKLSALLGSRVNEADVLNLALDGHLRIAVKLPDTDVVCFENETAERPTRRQRIDGVWVLPMVGAGRRQVESEMHRSKGLPTISMDGYPGAVVERDGMRCQLPPTLGHSGLYPYPASALPPDAVLVVEAAALDNLVIRLRTDAAGKAWGFTAAARSSVEQGEAEKAVGTRERATLLTLIAALAHHLEIDITKPSKAAATIEGFTTEIGARVSARTIENHLNDISDALERRGKTSY